MEQEMTFAQEIEEIAQGEPIINIVIGEFGWGGGYKEGNKKIPDEYIGKPISWTDARPFLDYTYDSGYGAPECHAIYAYTDNYIIYVSQYDGATSLNRIPRNPVACMPDMPGG